MLAAELVALAAALVTTYLLTPGSEWDPLLFCVLVGLAIASDLQRVEIGSVGMSVSASFLAIIATLVFLGPAPAAVVGMLTISAGWLAERYTAENLLFNLVTYAWFPLIAGELFGLVVEATGITSADPGFYLSVLCLFCFSLALNFAMVALYTRFVEGTPVRGQVAEALIPLLPSELASACLAMAIAFAYFEVGTAAVALFAIILLVFQRLAGALLVSEQRSRELEQRAEQIAGFQMGLLSALLRTLDLRDRMTARHSAAVARYTRELARRAGLSEEEQEIAHTAGLLHDIGKFSFSDNILKGDEKLSEADWQEIRKHPWRGAQIVASVDGYQPIGEIILAHHERIDGRGYPRGLSDPEIPRIARMISIADTYDVMTSRDSYKPPVTPLEAIVELRAVSGAQLDGELVELFIALLEDEGVAFRHGDEADFNAELALHKRARLHANRGVTEAPRVIGPRERDRQRQAAPL